MLRRLGKRWGFVAVVAAISAGGAGLVEASTSVDLGDLYPGCRGVLEHIGDGYCDRYGDDTNNVEECGFDGGDCCICTCVSTDYPCPDDARAYRCNDTSAECFGDPIPTPSPASGETEVTADDSSASLSGIASSTAAAAGALVATVLCGGFVVAVGW